MPVPGPRTQERPLPGYTNPGREIPTRINLWERPGVVERTGESPGTMAHSLRGHALGAGQVRRMWRPVATYLNAQAPYSWTENTPAPGRGVSNGRPYFITRALRYMTRSLYVQGGTDETRLSMLHSQVKPRAFGKAVTVPAGAVRSRPTVRNRLTSFGSRVPPINTPASGSENQ